MNLPSTSIAEWDAKTAPSQISSPISSKYRNRLSQGSVQKALLLFFLFIHVTFVVFDGWRFLLSLATSLSLTPYTRQQCSDQREEGTDRAKDNYGYTRLR